MSISLSRVGQLALTVDDTDVAEAFYCGRLGLPKLYRFGDLLFLDAAGLRLMIEKRPSPFTPASSTVYFRVPDITIAAAQLTAQGVVFVDRPHLVSPMSDHDLWMTFFKDPAGNLLALMCEAPRGWTPG